MKDASNQEISASRRKLQNPYAHLDGDGGYSGIKRAYTESFTLISAEEVRGEPFRERRDARRAYSDKDIEAIARRLQNAMWRRRRALAPEQVPPEPLSILKPEYALRALGYRFVASNPLGEFREGGVSIDVAGLFDGDSHTVSVSPQFDPLVRNFTAAHELGHAILHGQSGLHRDRPLDGSTAAIQRDPTEVEADKFAAFFLMPQTLVETAFERRFATNRFTLTDDNAFGLDPAGVNELAERKIPLRQLSKTLASANRFHAQHFESLASEFGVSVGAMAIRLEELGLVLE